MPENIVTPAGDDKSTVTEGQDNNINLPTTQEELLALLQSEGDKRVTQALVTNRAKLEAEYAAKLETEKEEAAKLAKMTAEQRKQAEFDKQLKEFESQKAEFTKSQLKMQTMTELSKENLPADFADFLMADSAEKTLENLNAFKATFQKAIQAEVDKRLAGPAPKTGVTAELTLEQFNKMSYKERVGLLSTNPELYNKLSGGN